MHILESAVLDRSGSQGDLRTLECLNPAMSEEGARVRELLYDLGRPVQDW
jgi:hypothetical protein